MHRWLVGVFLPATLPGFTILSSCCRLDPGAPPRGAGEALDDGGMDAGDDTGVVIPRLELGRGWGDMLRGIGDICGRGDACGWGDSCGEAWGNDALKPGVPLGT